jgi:hypothetical protein
MASNEELQLQNLQETRQS